MTEFSVVFQGQIIRSLLERPAFLGLYADIVHESYFEDPLHRMVVSDILSYFQKYKKAPDLSELVAMQRNDSSAEAVQRVLSDVMTYEGQVSTDFISDNLVEFARLQAVRLAYVETGDQIETGSYGSIKSIWDRALLTGVNRMDIGIDFFKDFDKRIDYRQNTDVCSTIWPRINKILDGGAWAKELYLIMTTPTGGKSTALMNVGLGGLLSGKFVVHVSTEMSDIKTSMRYDARIAGVPRRVLMQDPDSYREKVLKARAFFNGELLVKSYPPGVLTVDELYGFLATVQRVKERKIDLVIVDYPDEMRPMIRRQGREDKEAGEIFEGLRGLADSYACPVWAATQSKRDAINYKEWKEWTLGDLSESWDKAKKPDFVVAFIQTPDEYSKGFGNFLVLKNRDSERPARPIKLVVDFKLHKISEMRQQAEV